MADFHWPPRIAANTSQSFREVGAPNLSLGKVATAAERMLVCIVNSRNPVPSNFAGERVPGFFLLAGLDESQAVRSDDVAAKLFAAVTD